MKAAQYSKIIRFLFLVVNHMIYLKIRVFSCLRVFLKLVMNKCIKLVLFLKVLRYILKGAHDFELNRFAIDVSHSFEAGLRLPKAHPQI